MLLVSCATRYTPQTPPTDIRPPPALPSPMLAVERASATSQLLVPVVRKTPYVTLLWNIPTNQNGITGFRVSQGPQSQHFTNSYLLPFTNSASISNLVKGSTYYFEVRSVDNGGNESDASNEVSYTVPLPPPVTNYVILVIDSATSANGGWTNRWTAVLTNPPGESFFRFGISLTNGTVVSIPPKILHVTIPEE